MLTVRDLVDRGLLSPTVAEILFTSDQRKQKRMLSFHSLLQTSYRICLLYTALLQAYITGVAITTDQSVEDLSYAPFTNHIRKIWNPNESFTLDGMPLLSMLCDCSKNGNVPELLSEDAYRHLSNIRNQYSLAQKNTRYDPTEKLSDQNFTDLLSALPLLAATEYDDTDCKFIFHNRKVGTSFQISSTPFFGFWDERYDISTYRMTGSFFVLCSVKHGERNGELLCNILLSGEHSAKPTAKNIRYQTAKNEHLQMVCKANGFSVDSAPGGECFCDLEFLKTLTDTTCRVLSAFWEKHDRTPRHSITDKLKPMFVGSEIYPYIDENRFIPESDLKNIFYELYIRFGLFKTMHGLFLDTAAWSYGDELFKLYLKELDELVKSKKIDSKKREECVDLCQSNIAIHLRKLKEIVSEESKQYDHRSRMIRSEWQTFSILYAMGLQAKNLLTDEETIHSIDDYYDMLKTDRTRTTAGLKSVLLMLSDLYGSLLHMHGPFDEADFAQTAASLHQVNRKKDLETLICEFQEIVKESQNSESILRLIGRDQICSPKKLREFLWVISDNLTANDALTQEELPERKKIFISYSHKDSDKVTEYVNRLKAALQNECDIFFDTQLRAGQNWRRVAKAEIENPNCVAVVVFISKNSAISDAVRFELEHAEKYSLTAAEEFIIEVNIEAEDPEEYLKAAEHTSDNKSTAAQIIRRILNENKIRLTLPAQWNKLLSDIRTMITAPRISESVPKPLEYTPLELSIANFYAFLKLGDNHPDWLDSTDMIDHAFKTSPPSGNSCIFPLVVSVKETKIKRDSITLVGYEIIGKKGEEGRGTNYILSSRRLGTDDYYCIPNRSTTGHDCAWMVEPLLICHNLFPDTPEEDLSCQIP